MVSTITTLRHRRLHLYLYGGRFTVFTDHQTLVKIFTNPASKPSARLERWSLRLQPYDIAVCYQPERENPSSSKVYLNWDGKRFSVEGMNISSP